MLMDLGDLKTWTDGLAVVTGAPHIVVPLVIGAWGFGWWLKGAITEGQIKERDERLELAKERVAFAAEKEAEVTKRVAELEKKAAAGAPKEELAALSASVDASLGELKAANTATSHVLNAEGGSFSIKVGEAVLTVRDVDGKIVGRNG
jgi:hypothetical protein